MKMRGGEMHIITYRESHDLYYKINKILFLINLQLDNFRNYQENHFDEELLEKFFNGFTEIHTVINGLIVEIKSIIEPIFLNRSTEKKTVIIPSELLKYFSIVRMFGIIYTDDLLKNIHPTNVGFNQTCQSINDYLVRMEQVFSQLQSITIEIEKKFRAAYEKSIQQQLNKSELEKKPYLITKNPYFWRRSSKNKSSYNAYYE